MSTDVNVCGCCGRRYGEHTIACHRRATAVAASSASLPPLTAYEKSVARMVYRIEDAHDRLEFAMRRIEQLEGEMALLKSWVRPPEAMCPTCGTGFATPDHAQSHKCGGDVG